MKPTEKSKEIESFLESFGSNSNTGRSTSIQNNKCVAEPIGCGKLISLHESDLGDFRDEVSIKEYRISGLCQECQDKVFNSKPPETWHE